LNKIAHFETNPKNSQGLGTGECFDGLTPSLVQGDFQDGGRNAAELCREVTSQTQKRSCRVQVFHDFYLLFKMGWTTKGANSSSVCKHRQALSIKFRPLQLLLL
jgi:hypothetical protein